MSERLVARPFDALATQPLVPVARAEPPGPTPDRTRSGGRLNGLDVLRALACCLVFYTHVAQWYRLNDAPMGISVVLNDLLITPLRLNRDLGFVGVALFFLISGFVMAHVATKERTGEFAVKRLLRIFPALIVAALLSWVLVNAGLHNVPGNPDSVGVGDLFASMFLVNFFGGDFVPLVGVAWTLVTQLVVYALIGGMLHLFRRSAWIAVAVQITVCSVLLSVMPNLPGVPATALAVVGSFGTAIVLGEVIWLVWREQVPMWAGVLLGVACWLVFRWGDSFGYGRYDDSFTLTLTLAMVLVILAVVADQRVRRLRFVTYLSSRSYALYLVHQTTAFTMLALLWPEVPKIVAVPTAIVVTVAVAELLHRAVERPFAHLASTLTRRMHQRGAPRAT